MTSESFYMLKPQEYIMSVCPNGEAFVEGMIS